QGVGDEGGAGHGQAGRGGPAIIACGCGAPAAAHGRATTCGGACGGVALPPIRNDPAGAGSCGMARVGGYCRSHTCDLQRKATQPDTSSFLPPSTSSIFDLYTLPSSGLRMVPPA